jgi:Siphovirus Gp157
LVAFGLFDPQPPALHHNHASDRGFQRFAPFLGPGRRKFKLSVARRSTRQGHWEALTYFSTWEFVMNLEFAAAAYRAVRDRIRSEDPQIDEQTLTDTVEGLTDLHQILEAIIRSALDDEALAGGLKGRIIEMEERLNRFEDRASKRRQIAKDVMVELDLKKLTAPDFTASIRPGLPALMVIDEAAVPSIYWEPRDPRLNRQGLLADLKQGAEITGVTLSNPEPVLSVRTK